MLIVTHICLPVVPLTGSYRRAKVMTFVDPFEHGEIHDRQITTVFYLPGSEEHHSCDHAPIVYSSEDPLWIESELESLKGLGHGPGAAGCTCRPGS